VNGIGRLLAGPEEADYDSRDATEELEVTDRQNQEEKRWQISWAHIGLI
jgi:hypothetical protein